jgi:chemotaxis protein CheX
MEAEQSTESRDGVHVILSAKSSGPGGRTPLWAGRPREQTEQRLTEALDRAVAEVFEVMLGTSLRRTDQVALPRIADYTSMVGLAGDLCGVLSFRCGQRAAAQIAGKMLGTDEDTSDECIRDALGEISNMVAGSFKAQLSDLAQQCMLSVPTVVSGKDYQLYPLADGIRIQVSKSLDDALIWFTVDLHGV